MARALPDPYILQQGSHTAVHASMRQAACEAQQWPGPCALINKGVVLSVMQGPGDAIFVPSGWHHVVCNVTDVVSVNHNWINKYNIFWVVRHVQTEVTEAAMAIADIKELCNSEEEFRELVYRNAGINAGYSIEQLVGLLAEYGVCEGTQARALVCDVP